MTDDDGCCAGGCAELAAVLAVCLLAAWGLVRGIVALVEAVARCVTY